MSIDFSDVELRLSQIVIYIQSCWAGAMEAEARKGYAVNGKSRDYRPLTQANGRRSFSSSYFSIESILVLLCLAASLLLLPLVLPPLPPPPSMLLLLPICMLLVLMVLACMPSDGRDITSCYVQYGCIIHFLFVKLVFLFFALYL